HLPARRGAPAGGARPQGPGRPRRPAPRAAPGHRHPGGPVGRARPPPRPGGGRAVPRLPGARRALRHRPPRPRRPARRPRDGRCPPRRPARPHRRLHGPDRRLCQLPGLLRGPGPARRRHPAARPQGEQRAVPGHRPEAGDGRLTAERRLGPLASRPTVHRARRRAVQPTSPPPGGAGYPATFTLRRPEAIERWRPLVQWLLALPHWVILYALGIVSSAVSFLSWIAVLV